MRTVGLYGIDSIARMVASGASIRPARLHPDVDILHATEVPVMVGMESVVGVEDVATDAGAVDALDAVVVVEPLATVTATVGCCVDNSDVNSFVVLIELAELVEPAVEPPPHEESRTSAYSRRLLVSEQA